MSLKMILTGTQLKHFKGGLQCLGRLGSELLIEAIPEKLILRTINTAKSAYASVTFYSNFFESYDVFDATVIQAGVQMKQMLSVFRTQRITWLTCELSTTDNRFTAVLSTENGLQKEYRIPCMDSEILQAAVDKEAFPTCVIAGAAELNKLLGSFQSTLEEITIIATPDNSAGTGQAGKAVHIQSFFDPAKGKADKSLYTQLAVDTHEVFFSYQHSSEEASDVTFNLKDFKTMLSLCESMGANVAIRFDQPGQPLVVEPQFRGAHIQDVDYEAELVLATLMESQPHNLGSMQDAAAAPPTALNPRNQPHLRSGQAGSPNVPGDTPWRAPGYVTTPHTAIPTPNTHGFANGRMHDATGQRPTRFAGQHQQHQGQQQDEGRQFHAGGDVPIRYLVTRAAAQDSDEDEEEALPETPPG
ncbi:hypothetical protein WJX72_006295 [[Myrmecia] bisecta]|uniref:Cell cycle checkpoint control protein RAD9A n=1 Tax=[Myrmecia] bisecta TaxID=41462 RepID=A0AAW1R6Z1_9CHLO